MRRFIVFFLLLPSVSIAGSVTWVNDGGDGWDIYESVASDDMNAIKTAADDNDTRITTLEGLSIVQDSENVTWTGSHEFRSTAETKTASPDSSSAAAPTRVYRDSIDAWFAIDGIKENCIGEGTPDANCVGTGLEKTKTLGQNLLSVNVTDSEHFGRYDEIYAAGDTDVVGHGIKVYSTGGSQTSGDEGAQAIRTFVADHYILASFTGDYPATTGSVSVTNLSGLTEEEARTIGEGDLIVDVGNAVVVDLAGSLPPGTSNPGNAASGGWGTHQTAVAPFNWEIGAGEVASSGVAAGWCFSTDDSAYNDIGGTENRHWLYIAAVDSSTDTIRTEWIAQGDDDEYPFGYFGTIGTDTAQVAPCMKVSSVAYGSDRVPDSFVVVKEHSSVQAGATLNVSAYGSFRMNGVRSIISRQLGRASAGFGFLSSNNLSNGRYQLGSAYEAGYSGSLDNLDDGYIHAWNVGLECPINSCRYAVEYNWNNTTQPDTGAFALLDPPGTQSHWDGSNYIDVIKVPDLSGVFDIELNATEGWRVNGNKIAHEGADLAWTGAHDFSGASNLKVPTATDCSSVTAEGHLCWDSDNDILYIGNGSTATAINP